MRIVLKLRRVVYLSCAASPLYDGWACASVCCRLSPFTGKPPPLSLEKGERLRERGGRATEAEYRRRGKKRWEEGGRKGGKTHSGKHPLFIFSALNEAVSAWWSKALWMSTLRKAAGDCKQASKELAFKLCCPSAKIWLVGGANCGCTQRERHFL